VAESYGAASIATLATKMARAPFQRAAERVAVQAAAQLLMNRELTDPELAARVREAHAAWGAGAAVTPPTAAPASAAAAPVPPPAPARAPTPPPFAAPGVTAVVPVESLLYRGPRALARAREVRDALRAAWQERGGADPRTVALFDELSDLLDLAATA
jgi:hypothetical protein